MDEVQVSRKEILVDVAKMYYIEGLSQQEIANNMHMSRSNISRLLKSCIDNNIVEVKINDALAKSPDIAAAIKNAFGLKDVFIASSHNDVEKCIESVGALAAIYLNRILEDGMLLGFSSGRINYYVAQHLAFSAAKKVDVIQLLGGLSNKIKIDNEYEISKLFSNKLNGESYLIQAPMMVKSKLLRDLFLQETLISEIYKKYSNLDVTLIAIDAIKLQMNVKNREILLSKADTVQLMELGAVAEICGRFFDIDGNACNAGINERVIGIDIEMLKKISINIGISAGMDKLKATLSILRSGKLNVLVIDEMLARSLASFAR